MKNAGFLLVGLTLSVTFRFTGDFTRFDGEGGESESTVRASGSGTATLD